MVKAKKEVYSLAELAQVKELNNLDFGSRKIVKGFTIDNQTSRDLDDAIWVETQGDCAVVQVHIADPTEVIPLDSPLDKGIRKRISSLYLPGGTIPMIPAELSESQLSLLEGAPKLSITVEVKLNRMGEIESVEVFESCFISLAKLSYEQAEAIAQDLEHELYLPLNQAQLWAKILNYQRRKQGALAGIIKGQFYLDEDGSLNEITYKSQVLVAEYMILANLAVGSWLEKNSVLGIYRNHLPQEGVEKEAVKQLLSESSTELPAQLGHLLNKANYGRESRGHYALAVPHYLHFTSPLRRWADFLVHRCLKAYLKGESMPYSSAEIDQFAEEINEFQRRQKDSRNQYLKEKANQKLIKAVRSLGYSSLSKAELSRLIKLAIKENQPLQKIKPEIFFRAESGELSNNDYALFLFESNDLELQDLVKEYVPPNFLSGFFNNCPFVVPRVKRVEYSELGTNIANLVFKNRLFIELDNRILTTKFSVDGDNKQQAKTNASGAWLEAFLKDNLIEVAEVILELDDNSIDKDSEFKSPDNEPALILDSEELSRELPLQDLNNFCQQESLAKPKYNYYQKNGFFICEASLLYKGQVYQEQGVALKKRKAQNIAIDKILTAIGI
ncbi:MAG: RNB domain-containing ribonuclease [Xenococcus sp. MO_188.B8]|nr:RNB domain-containing ribonuclease [Xenococcus sp. MO_188.B8]